MFGRKAEVLREIRREQDPSTLRLLFDECSAQGWLTDGSLAGINLAGVDLSRMDLTGADLSRAVVVDANLRRARLHHAILDEADLSGSDLGDADLREATFENTQLQRANLRGAQVREEQLSIAETLARATLPDGLRYDGRFSLQRDLLNARRDGAYPDNAEKMSAWYEVSQGQYEAGRQWAEDHLADTRQAGFTFAEADVDWLAEARASGRLNNGSLRGEDLSEINLAGCDLSRANLSRAILDNASLLRSDLSFADLSKAALSACDLDRANLSHALLRGADLSHSVLSHADLRGADLTGAVLDEVKLYDANLSGARVDQAQLVRAEGMRLATMPDARPYDGRYEFNGDLDRAQDFGIDIEDSEQMAAWYDVDVKDYMAGQKWAEANLGALLPEED